MSAAPSVEAAPPLAALARSLAALDPLGSRELELEACAVVRDALGAEHVVLEVASDGRPARVFGSAPDRHALAGDPFASLRDLLDDEPAIRLDRLADAAADDAAAPALAQKPVLAVAVASGPARLGSLFAVGKPGGFTLDDAAVAELAAAYLAQALVSARLHGQALAHRVRVQAQSERLGVLDRVRGQLVPLVSHGLRTPLTAIIGYLDLMLDGDAGPLTVQQRQFLKTMEANSDRLLKLLDELLLVAELEAGTSAALFAAVNMTDLVGAAVARAKTSAARRKIRLDSSIRPLPTLRCVRSLMDALLDVLVGNAVACTPEGGYIEIRAHAEAGSMVLEIQDSGIGISAREQRRVFDLLFRTSSSIDAKIPGLGIGLYKAKKIVDAHRGEISIESEERQGALVRVVLPLG